VEHDAVVELLARQRLDAFDMLGREIGAQFDNDLALARLDDQGVFGIFVFGH